MSLHCVTEGVYKVRWRQGGRNKSLTVHGPRELAKKIERKKLSTRDENRHLDVRKEVNFRMTALIDRYWQRYGIQKKSSGREKAVLEGIRKELGHLFVREVEGCDVDRWYRKLTEEKGLSPGTAVRHFTVMHHMMGKAATIWSNETGINRNPADLVEVRRPNDERDRYLSPGAGSKHCTARRLRNPHTHRPRTAPAHRFRVGRQPKWQTVKVIGKGDLTHHQHHNI